MSNRPSRPEGYPWLSPAVIFSDIDKDLPFYEKAFGFTKKMGIPGDNGKTAFAEVLYKDQLLMVSQEGAFGNPTQAPTTSKSTSPISLYLYCDDVNKFYEHAIANGAESIEKPADTFWGDRMCRLRCPNGYIWGFATNVADFDPSNMPQ